MKGQVTIPKPVRDHLGLHPGDRVRFEVDERGLVVLHKAGPQQDRTPAPDRFRRLMGTANAIDGMSTDDLMRLVRGVDD